MSKFALAAAAVLALAVSTEGYKFEQFKQTKDFPKRKVAQKMRQAPIRSFDEEEWSGYVDANYSNRGGVGVGIGITHTWDEEQKINIAKSLKKAANVIVKANELGLLEEDQWGGEVYGEVGSQGGQRDWKVGGRVTFDEEEAEQKFKLGSALKKAANVVVKANELGLLEEEMDEEQKFKLGKALKKVANVVVKANELGLLEEDQDELQGVWGPIVKEVAKEVGKSVLVSTISDGIKTGVGNTVKWVRRGFHDEDEWSGEVYGDVSGGRGRKPDWKVGGKITFDEEEAEQKIKIGKILKKAANVVVKANELGLLEEEEWGGEVYGEAGRQGGQSNWKVGGRVTFDEEEAEQKFKLGKALKKAANVIVKANELGLLEEEEWGGEVYGEVGSQGGQRDWKVGGRVTFDEEEAEQKIKIGKVLNTAVKVVTVAAEVGLLEEDFVNTEQKIKLGSAIKKAANVIVKANELGLLEEAIAPYCVCVMAPCPCSNMRFEESEYF